VLVDLNLSKWEENAQCKYLSRTVPNGIALAAILQQHAVECEHPTAFALHSAHLVDLTKPFPPLERVHLIARTYNVEWAFLKSTPDKSPAELFPKIRILADAVAVLPDKWPENDTEKAREIARKLLAVPDNERWSDQAWEDAEAAQPPLDELTLRIHGILFLRWILTRVIYYPCFLLDRYWVAARLGATPQSVDAALSGRLGEFLSKSQYVGILDNFAGRRWWRAGLEASLWDLVDGKPVGRDELLDALREKHGVVLDPTPCAYPVVCLDENYKPLNHLFDPKDCVRLQLDDWPSHADTPRTTRELLADNPRFQGLVVHTDR
jgi:hypothetical protein